MRSIARWQIFAARPRRGPAQPAAKSTSPSRLGPLPKWNLADLYGGIDDPHVKPNLDRASAESVTFEECLRAQAPHGTQRGELAADRLSALVRSAVGEPRGGGRAQARCAYA
jgi:hypothetical protein